MQFPPSCFASGTAILTAQGEAQVETLRCGDRLAGPSGGRMRVRRLWMLALSHDALAADPAMAPVRIRAGALGADRPVRDLVVSPATTLMVPGTGVGVPAALLVNGRTILRDTAGPVTLHQIDRDQPAALLAEGVLVDLAELPPLCARVLRARDRLMAFAGMTPGPLEGSLDRCDRTGVSGWVRDLSAPDIPVALEVRIDGARTACLLARGRRDDLVDAGKGECAFRLDFDPPPDPARPCLIRVARLSDGAPVAAADILLDAVVDPGARLHAALATLGPAQLAALRALLDQPAG